MGKYISKKYRLYCIDWYRTNNKLIKFVIKDLVYTHVTEYSSINFFLMKKKTQIFPFRICFFFFKRKFDYEETNNFDKLIKCAIKELVTDPVHTRKEYLILNFFLRKKLHKIFPLQKIFFPKTKIRKNNKLVKFVIKDLIPDRVHTRAKYSSIKFFLMKKKPKFSHSKFFFFF